MKTVRALLLLGSLSLPIFAGSPSAASELPPDTKLVNTMVCFDPKDARSIINAAADYPIEVSIVLEGTLKTLGRCGLLNTLVPTTGAVALSDYWRRSGSKIIMSLPAYLPNGREVFAITRALIKPKRKSEGDPEI